MSANNGPGFNNFEVKSNGKWHTLLNNASEDLYNIKDKDMMSSAFEVFPFEVLEVFSPSPNVVFSWRHWGYFTGTYKENKGNGELIELFGWAEIELNDK